MNKHLLGFNSGGLEGDGGRSNGWTACYLRADNINFSKELESNNKMFSLKLHIILNTSENTETACM